MKVFDSKAAEERRCRALTYIEDNMMDILIEAWEIRLCRKAIADALEWSDRHTI